MASTLVSALGSFLSTLLCLDLLALNFLSFFTGDGAFGGGDLAAPLVFFAGVGSATGLGCLAVLRPLGATGSGWATTGAAFALPFDFVSATFLSTDFDFDADLG